MDQSWPVEKFWNQPELIEMLFSFLNARSTLCLLQSKVMDKETQQKSFSSKAWNQLIERTLRGHDGLLLSWLERGGREWMEWPSFLPSVAILFISP